MTIYGFYLPTQLCIYFVKNLHCVLPWLGTFHHISHCYKNNFLTEAHDIDAKVRMENGQMYFSRILADFLLNNEVRFGPETLDQDDVLAGKNMNFFLCSLTFCQSLVRKRL